MASPPTPNETAHRLSHRPRRDRGEEKEATSGYAASDLQSLWDSQDMTQYQVPRVVGNLATSTSQIHSFAGSQESTFSSDIWPSQNSAVDSNSSQQLGYPVPAVLQGHVSHNNITSSVYQQSLQDFNAQMPTPSHLGSSPYNQLNRHPSPSHAVTNHQGQYIPDLVQTQGFPISNMSYPQLSNDLQYGHLPAQCVERGTSRMDRGQSDRGYNRVKTQLDLSVATSPSTFPLGGANQGNAHHRQYEYSTEDCCNGNNDYFSDQSIVPESGQTQKDQVHPPSTIPSPRGNSRTRRSHGSHSPESITPTSPSELCDFCGKILTGPHAKGNLRRHQKTSECPAPLQGQAYLCKHCPKSYRRSDALRNHQKKSGHISDQDLVDRSPFYDCRFKARQWWI